jgi:FkbM family methyltransferase
MGGGGGVLARQRAAIAGYGLGNWARLKLHRLGRAVGGGAGPRALVVPDLGGRVDYRPGTSDLAVFDQIFIEREYDTVAAIDGGGLIVDCGANVGYSSVYFLSRFPACTAVAVEPDPGNFAMLTRNLARFGDRARARRAAVWSGPAQLAMSSDPYRDGREWSRQVREVAGDAGGLVPAVGIADLLAGSGFDRIALLKVDIEGAEAVVFGPGCEAWIDRVDRIAIELHDDTPFGDARGVFARAIAGRGFATHQAGELTICTRRPPG